MPRTGSHQDFDHFDEWETFDMDDDIYAGVETDLLEDWEDDGAIAEVREPVSVRKVTSEPVFDEISETEPIELDEESAEVFSLLERAQSKKSAQLEGISGPSEDELSAIEKVGIDEYIDQVLNEESEIQISVDNSSSSEEPLSGSVVSDDVVAETKSSLREDSPDESDSSLLLDSEFETFEDVDVEPIMSFGEEDSEVGLVVEPLFVGVACALPTLFDEDGETEYKTTARLAKRLVQTHTAALFVATPSGEGQTLSRKERKNLVKEIVKATPENLVIADVTAPSIRQSVQIAEDVKDVKADAFVVEISQGTKDPYALCEALHNKYYDTPIFVRLVGKPLDLPITPEFLFDLPISGVIDETGDAAFLLHLVSVYTGPIYVGAISTIALGSTLGVAGVVTSSAAIADDVVALAFAGDVDAQLQLAADERDFGGFSAQRIKQVLESQDLISSTTRD
jgi:4-hydroxy-tetrahydrodipicolinate synthase